MGSETQNLLHLEPNELSRVQTWLRNMNALTQYISLPVETAANRKIITKENFIAIEMWKSRVI